MPPAGCGASSGLMVLLRLLVGAGDEIVMMSPPWFFYEALVLAESGEPVEVPLKGDTFDLDLDAIERAITPRTGAVIVNTPHNPSGRIYPGHDLRALAAILEQASERNGRRVYLISDEAYARILFDERPLITPGRFYPATFMLHTYSKTLLAPSQGAGYLAMPPAMPGRERLRAAAVGHVEHRRRPGHGDAARDARARELEHRHSLHPAPARPPGRGTTPLRLLGRRSEGALYLFPRSPIPEAIELCDWLAERGVYTLPGEAFERPGYFRLSLTATDAMVDRALPVLAGALQTLAPGGSQSAAASAP